MSLELPDTMKRGDLIHYAQDTLAETDTFISFISCFVCIDFLGCIKDYLEKRAYKDIKQRNIEILEGLTDDPDILRSLKLTLKDQIKSAYKTQEKASRYIPALSATSDSNFYKELHKNFQILQNHDQNVQAFKTLEENYKGLLEEGQDLTHQLNEKTKLEFEDLSGDDSASGLDSQDLERDEETGKGREIEGDPEKDTDISGKADDVSSEEAVEIKGPASSTTTTTTIVKADTPATDALKAFFEEATANDLTEIFGTIVTLTGDQKKSLTQHLSVLLPIVRPLLLEALFETKLPDNATAKELTFAKDKAEFQEQIFSYLLNAGRTEQDTQGITTLIDSSDNLIGEMIVDSILKHNVEEGRKIQRGEKSTPEKKVDAITGNISKLENASSKWTSWTACGLAKVFIKKELDKYLQISIAESDSYKEIHHLLLNQEANLVSDKEKYFYSNPIPQESHESLKESAEALVDIVFAVLSGLNESLAIAASMKSQKSVIELYEKGNKKQAIATAKNAQKANLKMLQEKTGLWTLLATKLKLAPTEEKK